MEIKKQIISILDKLIENGYWKDYDQEFMMESLSFVKFIIMLEQTFCCEIPPEKLLMSELNTINKISNLVLSLKTK